jgi:ABC-type transport system involved in cytochrome c biogenesis permease subunit
MDSNISQKQSALFKQRGEERIFFGYLCFSEKKKFFRSAKFCDNRLVPCIPPLCHFVSAPLCLKKSHSILGRIITIICSPFCLSAFAFKLCMFLLVIMFNFSGGMGAQESYEMLPVAYNGRFLPLDVYAKLELQKFYGKQYLKQSDFPDIKDRSALAFLLNFYLLGSSTYDNSPLFSVHFAELKNTLGLDPLKSHFSYKDLQHTVYSNEESNLRLMRLLVPYFYVKNSKEMPSKSSKQEIYQLATHLFATIKDGHLTVANAPKLPPWNFLKTGSILSDNLKNVEKFKPVVDEALNLLSLMSQYRNWNGIVKTENLSFENAFNKLKEEHIEPKEMAVLLESEFPLLKRLENSGNFLKVLPLKNTGVFISLEALKLKTYDSKTNSLKYVSNFTPYRDNQFKEIQQAYFNLQISVKEQKDQTTAFKKLANLLNESYKELAGTPVKIAFQKTLYYPTKNQLLAEYLYYHYPLVKITIILYAIALLTALIGKSLNRNSILKGSLWVMGSAFMMHSLILSFRCYILNRPPVSNMFETVIYVPWIAMIAGFIFYLSYKHISTLIASCFLALSLLILLEITGMNEQLENVQAVLDSEYWLIVHVLLIVGSYGVFFLCGIIGQSYLFHYFFKAKETEEMKFLGKAVLHMMYLGCLMLIPGTILGGVWAAESWGRFWDWDPKESWAFISSCIYLIFIHAFRFKKISSFGLCVGSVIGLLAISFTWYGVNYILGTGLHSYGFGSGGEIYYYIFLLSQITFLIIVSYKHKNMLEMKSQNMI